MVTLRRKLWRDLLALRGQGAAIGLIIAAGVMMLIVSVTSLDAIVLSQERFYTDYRFADVFVEIKRAPEGVATRARDIPGVNQVQTRVQAPVRLEVPGYDDPVSGQILSIPDGRQPDLNRLYIREGALPESGRADQVLISEPFAQAHGLRAGDTLRAIINGRLETLSVSGVALSPEFVYQIGPADLLPDYERFGVLWMNRTALAAAFDMAGAFNSLALTLQAGADEAPVIDALDALFERWGGVGAYGREDQPSHRFLGEEINQLRVMAVVLPVIFLGVAAFLLNVLMARIINTQRQQVAVLKAFGYYNREVGWYYTLLTAAVVLVGSTVGVVFGAWAADALAAVYLEYFRFPELSFRLQPRVVVLGVAVAGLAAGVGTWRALRGVVSLPPAEAMRPPAPESFRQGLLERAGIGRWLDQPGRIILRNLGRHRFKAVFSIVGIALSGGLLLLGSYQFNAIDHLIDTQYRTVLKMDVVLHFSQPTPARALAELRQQPGVRFVEGYRNVPVRLVHGRQEYRTAIQGMAARPQLRGLIDDAGRDLSLPPEGLVMTDYLADYLGLQTGDRVVVEIMEGQRRTVEVALAGVVSEPLGVSAYMEITALNRLLREGPAISGAWLLTDRALEPELFDRLWDVPKVAGIGMLADAARQIREYIADTVLVMMGILLLLAGSIAFAVLYNNARIAFAERAREMATLRVLGFTRGEVAWILIGELVLLTLLAIPLGWLVGTGMAWLLTEAMALDLYRIPFIITHQTYAFAAAGVLAAAALSVALVARRLARLDMLSALKTVE